MAGLASRGERDGSVWILYADSGALGKLEMRSQLLSKGALSSLFGMRGDPGANKSRKNDAFIQLFSMALKATTLPLSLSRSVSLEYIYVF